MDVEVPSPKMTPQKRANLCIELAFNALMDNADTHFDGIQPTMGLMYLSDLAVTKQFQEACRAVLRLQGAEF